VRFLRQNKRTQSESADFSRASVSPPVSIDAHHLSLFGSRFIFSPAASSSSCLDCRAQCLARPEVSRDGRRRSVRPSHSSSALRLARWHRCVSCSKHLSRYRPSGPVFARPAPRRVGRVAPPRQNPVPSARRVRPSRPFDRHSRCRSLIIARRVSAPRSWRPTSRSAPYWRRAQLGRRLHMRGGRRFARTSDGPSSGGSAGIRPSVTGSRGMGPERIRGRMESNDRGVKIVAECRAESPSQNPWRRVTPVMMAATGSFLVSPLNDLGNPCPPRSSRARLPRFVGTR